MLADTGWASGLHGDRAAQHLSRVPRPYKTGRRGTCRPGRPGSYGRPGPAQNPTSGPSFVSPSRCVALLSRTSNHPCPTAPVLPLSARCSLAGPRACSVPADCGFPKPTKTEWAPWATRCLRGSDKDSRRVRTHKVHPPGSSKVPT
jgi:hypothetical protein